jgi:SAM-dependent methyltransferase
MADHRGPDPPSAFVVGWAGALFERLAEPRRALDVAMGRGRHAESLAAAGYRAFGVDVKLDAVRDAVGRAGARGLVVRGWCADLTMYPLPSAAFELAVVTRYLQRDLFPVLRNAVRPGGAVIYETFTEAQRALGRGPTSPDHLLRPGELRAFFEDFDLLFYEEVLERDALARIVARRAAGGQGL